MTTEQKKVPSSPEHEKTKPTAVFDRQALAKEGEQFRSNYQLPTAELFPKTIRKRIREKTQLGDQKIQESYDTAERIILIDQDLGDIEAQVLSSENKAQIQKQAEQAAHQKIQQMTEEIRLLSAVQKRIKSNRNAYELLSRPPFYQKLASETTQEYQGLSHRLSKEDHEEVGPTRNPAELLNRKLRSRNDGFQRGIKREQYTKDVSREYNERLTQLGYIINRRGLDPDTTFPIKQLSLDSTKTVAEQRLPLAENQQQRADRVSQQLYRQYFAEEFSKQIPKWLQENQAQLGTLNEIQGYDERSAAEKYQREFTDSAHNLQTEQRQTTNFTESLLKNRENIFSDELNKLAETVKTFLETYSLGFPSNSEGLDFLDYSFFPAEAADQLFQLLVITRTLMQHLTKQQIGSPDATPYNKLQERTQRQILEPLLNLNKKLQIMTTKKKEVPGKEDVLWHGVSYEALTEKILAHGSMSSRKYQLEHFGEASFYSAGVIAMTKETVTVRTPYGNTETMSWEQYDKRKEGDGMAKDLFQEADQLCFQENSPYMYFNGNAILFDKASVYANAQFMAADGIHFFDPEFKTGRPESPGFHLDLFTQPFVMLFEPSKKNEVTAFVTKLLQEDENWKKHQLTPEQWIADHVLFVADARKHVSEINAAAQALFKKQTVTPVAQGFFLPTGQRGETASRSQIPLYAYRTETQLRQEQEKDLQKFNPTEVNTVLDTPEFKPETFITALSQNSELKDLFEASAGVAERYSVKEHTLMVMNLFEKFHAKKLAAPKMKRIFRALLSLHDIGKSVAVITEGSTQHQHEYTLPILNQALQELQFSEVDRQLAETLVNQDYLGDYLQNYETTADIADKIVAKAQEISMDPQELFQLLQIFYLSDAGAYTKYAGGKMSLDKLFDVDLEKQEMDFSLNQTSTDRENNYDPISPKAKILRLEKAIQQKIQPVAA